MKTVPHKEIVWTSGITTRSRRGKMQTAVLVCTHWANTTALERERGKVPCLDCFNGKGFNAAGHAVIRVAKPLHPGALKPHQLTEAQKEELRADGMDEGSIKMLERMRESSLKATAKGRKK